MNIVVTGASKGIGKAIVFAFAKDKTPHRFFICARNESCLKTLKHEVEAEYPQHEVNIFSCDMADKNDVQAFAVFIQDKIHAADVLINNAGIYFPGSCYNEEDGVLEKMLEVNLLSAYRLTRALLPGMMQIRKGQVFNLCSIASLQAYANGGSYSISKFALAGFTKNLREELQAHNIRVTSISPGPTLTASWEGFEAPPGRMMPPEDIASVVWSAWSLAPQTVIEEILLRPMLGDF